VDDDVEPVGQPGRKILAGALGFRLVDDADRALEPWRPQRGADRLLTKLQGPT
jgi:hypothetical protein